MIKSGLIYPFGMGFWGPNGHDGVWHIALINHLAKNSFEMPVFSGEALKNYHIGFDLVLAVIHKITEIPAHTLYFQILPPILAILIGWLTYKFVLQWKKSKIQASWATFFVYFAGDFGWILTFFRKGEIGGESLFWAQQAVSTLINPPFAVSLVLLLVGMIFLLRLQERFKIYDIKTRASRRTLFLALPEIGITILIFGLLAQTKIYAGLLALGGLSILVLWELFRKRRFTQKCTLFLTVLVGSAFISVLLFLPLNSGAQRLIVVQPFWFLETMMAVSDRVGWERFYEAMTSYKTGNVWVKLVPAYIIAFLIFFVGNMGTRLLGIAGVIKERWERGEEITLFMLGIALLGTILPMVVLQAGTPWNTIQFFYYTLFICAIFTGISLGRWLETNKIKLSIFILVVLLTLPTTFSTLLRHYLPPRPPAKISHEELEALRFLGGQPQGSVLTYTFDRYKASLAIAHPPRSLYVYESTAYVAAFSGHPVYLEDEVNLDITGYDWRSRRELARSFFDTLGELEARKFLKDNKIKYLYLVPSQSQIVGQRFRLGETQLGITNIFENKEVVIYQVMEL